MSDGAATASRISTHDGPSDPYDHEIALVDTTDPDAAKGTENKLKKKPTRLSVREQLAKRKYARYSYERYSKNGGGGLDDEGDDGAEGSEVNGEPPAQAEETEAVDFAHRGRKSKDGHRKHTARTSEVDILYENQRGSFFFGKPLYSHSSLLNFDPGAWVTKDFKDSPVNITNSQVPDPTWEWAWKSWYVDMSHDVDEEGWQYSFSFNSRFAWHGTHPWFHSFVRRRRWLRKRVKSGKGTVLAGKPDNMSAAHKLNTDYFTIHPKRERSPESKRPASYTSVRSVVEPELPPEDIKDVGSLMRALRFAAVDREKIDLVKKFIRDGGEELAYLKELVPEIMSLLIFQSSRQQLLTYLKQTANEAKEHREEHEADDKPEGKLEKARTDNLLAAIDAANQEIGALEYWSDRKHILKTADSEAAAIQTIATIFDKPAPQPDVDVDPVENIKGISNDAEVGVDQAQKLASTANKQSSEPNRTDKGKGKAKEEDIEQDRASSPPRLKADQVLIPD